MTLTWFNENTNAQAVGGKGFNLCRMSRAGLPVPPGFCIPWEDLNKTTGHDMEIALSRLGAKAVAVRSSAIDEDGVTASFAGVYRTRLNVAGAEAVARSVEEIGNSAMSAESLAYRKKRGITGRPKMAAVVQEFLCAEASGVFFMRDPVDGSERFIVEGSWGLGEAVVAGMVTPDRWVV